MENKAANMLTEHLAVIVVTLTLEGVTSRSPESGNLLRLLTFTLWKPRWSLAFSRGRASKTPTLPSPPHPPTHPTPLPHRCHSPSARLGAKSHKPEAVFSVPLTFRRHEAADGRADANDARTPAHDASPSTHDDASQAGHDATGQIRARRSLPIFVAVYRDAAAHGRTSAHFLCTLNPQKTTPLLSLLSFFWNATRMVFIAIYTRHYYYFFLTIFEAFMFSVLMRKNFTVSPSQTFINKHLKTLFWYDSRGFCPFFVLLV